MANKKLIVLLFGSLTLCTSANLAAYTLGASYSWVPGDPNYNPAAIIHTGTINTSSLVMGDFVGRDASNPNASYFGSSGTAVGWDDTWQGSVGNANTNGDALDGLWSSIYSDGGWWDMGIATDTIAVFTSQDHSPYLAEGLEYWLFGTNTLWDDTSLSTQALITDVYLDGWRTHNAHEDSNGNGWLSDDVAGVFNFDASYQYIKLVAWDTSGTLSEPEVDAIARVAPVPEPTTMLLFGIGLTGLVGSRLRKKKSNSTSHIRIHCCPNV